VQRPHRRTSSVGPLFAEEAVAVAEEQDAAPAEAVASPEEAGAEEQKKLNVQDLQTGQELQGSVTKVIKMGAFVDVKAERPGLVPRNKLRSGFTASVGEVVKVGDKVTVWVSEANAEKFILSMVKGKAYAPSAAGRAPIDLLAPLAGATGEDAWLDGKVARSQPWGAFVSVVPPGAGEGEQVQGLVHKTQIQAGGFRGSVEEELPIGKSVRVRVLSVDSAASRAAFSMIDPADEGSNERQQAEDNDKYTAELGQFHDIAGLPDEWLDGKVVQVTNIGAFVSVKGPAGGDAEAKGFVHKSQVAEGFVSDVRDAIEVGQEVKVRVVKVNIDEHKLFLSMVQEKEPIKKKEVSLEDAARFSDLAGGDQWLLGKVDSLAAFGAFVEVSHPSGEGEPVTGLVHITEMKDGFVENINDIAEVGQEVRVRVVAVDAESGKVSLSLRDPSERRGRSDEPRDLSAFQGLSSDEWLTGTVSSLHNFGVFVEVAPPEGSSEGGASSKGMGLVHISQIKDGYVEDVGEVVEVDQVVQVRVIEVDSDKGRLSLSMLSPKEGQTEEGEEEGEES